MVFAQMKCMADFIVAYQLEHDFLSSKYAWRLFTARSRGTLADVKNRCMGELITTVVAVIDTKDI
jgi:hypothetical protein